MAVLNPSASVAHERTSVKDARWLVLLIFLPLPLCQELGVPGATSLTSACGFAWFLGIASLLWASDKPLRSTLWVWTIVFVFLMGFYVKYFAFAFGMGSPLFDLLNPELSWADRENLNDALVWSTIGFLVFAVTATVILRVQTIPFLPRPPNPERIRQRNLYIVLLLTFLGVLGSLVAALVFGFGQMGLEHHELPFHLDAVSTRFRISLAPAIFIVSLWVSDNHRNRRLWMATVFTMVVCAVLDAYVRGSRGSIVLAFLPLIFLWCLTGTYTAGRKALTFAIILLTVVLYPLLTGLRGERIASGQGIDFDSKTASQQASSAEGIGISLDQVAGRIVGIDSMIEIRRHMRELAGPESSITTFQPSRLPWLANGGQMVTYMTHTVVGIPEEVVEGRSPGFLGGLYLVGGPDGMVIFTILYVTLVAVLWKRISKHSYAAPLLAYIASVILSYTEEGVYGLENPISALLAILLVVWLFKRLIVAPANSVATSGLASNSPSHAEY